MTSVKHMKQSWTGFRSCSIKLGYCVQDFGGLLELLLLSPGASIDRHSPVLTVTHESKNRLGVYPVRGKLAVRGAHMPEL